VVYGQCAGAVPWILRCLDPRPNPVHSTGELVRCLAFRLDFRNPLGSHASQSRRIRKSGRLPGLESHIFIWGVRLGPLIGASSRNQISPITMNRFSRRKFSSPPMGTPYVLMGESFNCGYALGHIIVRSVPTPLPQNWRAHQSFEASRSCAERRLCTDCGHVLLPYFNVRKRPIAT
jgi:hypothetical protein